MLSVRTSTAINHDISVFVDVDDTLTRSASSKRIPIPAVIQQFRDLHAPGAILYCWSAGGGEYARRSAEELGFADCFAAFLPKPNVMIDDQKPANLPRRLTIHPLRCPGQTVDGYRALLLTIRSGPN